MTEPVRIAMWSGPRNISTAMMRSFENRPDTAAWDEPFYACFLKDTGIDHPMHDEIIAAYQTDWSVVAGACADGPVPGGGQVFFQKQMTHHLLRGVELGWLARVTNFFLIRRPEDILASYHDRRANPVMADVGFDRQAELFDLVCDMTGTVPPVIDARDVLEDPQRTLHALCAAVGIDFDDKMLAWPPGRRPSDGVWAPHWYASVEASTGFSRYKPSTHSLPDHLRPLMVACRPYYEKLAAHRL